MLRSKLARIAVVASLTTGGALGLNLVGASAAHADPNVCVDTSGSVGCSGFGPLADPVPGTVEGIDNDNDSPTDLLYFAVNVDVPGTNTETCEAGDAVCTSGVGVSAELGGSLPTAPTGELEVCAPVVGCGGIESNPNPG